MSQLLAIEWDGYEARIAAAHPRGNGVIIEHAFCVALAPRDPGKTFADVNVGERIGAALAARGIGRSEALVSVGRASIELRLLTLPAADEEELPEMVRFQAQRQFSTLGDDWPLDFVQVGATADGGSSVLAAAISPKLVSQIEKTCQAGGLKPKRFVLRPFAAASLLCRKDERPASRVRLMVDLLSDEADLTVLIDRKVVFMRTVRLYATPSAAEESTELVSEIRRTMAAAQNQLGGQRVDSLVLCSAGGEHSALQDHLSEKLDLPVGLFDPFDGLTLAREVESHPPDAPGRFAPLLGLLLDEATKKPHAIDFLHPRKKPEAPNRNKVLIAAAAVAAVLVVALLGYTWILFSNLASDKSRLSEQLEGLEKGAKIAEKSIGRLVEIEQWTSGDMVWLDELREFSLRMPPAEEAIVVNFQAGSQTKGGGVIVIDGVVSSTDTIGRLEQDINDPKYTVKGGSSSENDSYPGYGYSYQETISIRAPSDDHEPVQGEKTAPAPESLEKPIVEAKDGESPPNTAKTADSRPGGTS